MRTRRPVTSRFAPVNPFAIPAVISGVVSMPIRTSTEISSISSANTVRAACAASPSRPCARRLAWIGMKDPERAPSPNRFCSRLGMRTAALNASAASDWSPKKNEKMAVRARPESRLARMPAAPMWSARHKRGGFAPAALSAPRRQLGPRQPIRGVCRLPGKPRHHHGVLLQILLAHPFVQVHVRVMHAHVVVLVLLDRIEAGHADGTEAEMIGVADPGNDVAPHAEILERFEPLVEGGLPRLAVLHVPPVNRAARRIHVQVHEQAIARVLVRVTRQMFGRVRLRAEQALFLTAPQRRADRPLAGRAHRLEDAHG